MRTPRLLIVDDSAVPWWQFWRADPWFEVGGRIAELCDAFDAVLLVKTPDEAMRAIHRYEPHHVQVWGHGAPGRPLIGGKPLRADVPGEGRWGYAGEVWFRSCRVAQGAAGIAFMEQVAAHGVDVAAHLSTIGALGHSNLVGVRASGRAFWSPKAKPAPGFARFVLPVELELPGWAFEEG